VNLTVGSRWFNEFRINFSEQSGASLGELDTHDGAVVPDTGLLYPSAATPDTDTIGIQVGPASSRASYFTGPIANNRQRQFHIVDSMNATMGKHLVKFGGDYRVTSPTRAPGELGLTRIFSTAADVRNGVVSSFSSALNAPIGTTTIPRMPSPTVRIVNTHQPVVPSPSTASAAPKAATTRATRRLPWKE
jgi:hypothetical protein